MKKLTQWLTIRGLKKIKSGEPFWEWLYEVVTSPIANEHAVLICDFGTERPFRNDINEKLRPFLQVSGKDSNYFRLENGKKIFIISNIYNRDIVRGLKFDSVFISEKSSNLKECIEFAKKITI
jgi:hypothetical protein